MYLCRAIVLLSFLLVYIAPSAWATFPVVASVALSDGEATSRTDHVITLPASIASGDLIIVWMFLDGQGTATIPSPWVEIRDTTTTSVQFYVAYLIASGGETTVTITSSVSEKMTALAARITAASWHGTTAPEISTGATGLDTAPDPDSVTASWGSDDNLFIAISCQDINGDVTGYPTNYADNQNATNGGVGGSTSSGEGGIATRNLAAASDDPGTFTIDASEDWIAATMVVRPAAAGGGPTIRRRAPVVIQ